MAGLTALVDLQAIPDNLRVIRSLAGARAVMASIKANAYGHGLLPGQRASVSGRPIDILSVSLEHTVVDLTDVGGIGEGTTVHLLTRDPALGPTLEDVAQAQGRAAAEVLVALTGRASYRYLSATE